MITVNTNKMFKDLQSIINIAELNTFDLKTRMPCNPYVLLFNILYFQDGNGQLGREGLENIYPFIKSEVTFTFTMQAIENAGENSVQSF